MKNVLVSVCLFPLLVSFLGTGQGQPGGGAATRDPTLDSVTHWMALAEQRHVSEHQRYDHLERALELAKGLKTDSIRLQKLSALSYRLSRGARNDLFRRANWGAQDLARKLKDSLALANSYWDLGDHHVVAHAQDSAYLFYSKAQNIFSAQGEALLSARMLIQMANRQEKVKDYLGSEANLFAAIRILEPLKGYRHLYRCYNGLGIVAKDLGQFNRAIGYYERARGYLQKLDGETVELLRNSNNMGVVYRQKKDHAKAINFFQEITQHPNIKENHPELYGIALNNLAYCKIKLRDTAKVLSMIEESVKINDSLGNVISLASAHSTLSELALIQKDTSMAIHQSQMAVDLSKKGGDFYGLLNVLAFLSQIHRRKAPEYAAQYIKLNDSLQRTERQLLNKFARIRYETDNFIAQNKQLEADNELLAQEKRLLVWLAVGFISLGAAISMMISQRIKNQKFRFKEQQQLNNQEIFNLMLSQKQKVDEAKRLEQKRISEELHDGILGKMLGARMVLTGLNNSNGNGAVQERAQAISALKNVENEIRSLSHELSHSAYTKMNNFINSIAIYLKSVEDNHSVKTHFLYEEHLEWDELKGEIKINIYRIVQESLQNAIKHAACSNFFLTFAWQEDTLMVDIKDDGQGFDTKRMKKGIGLRNIGSRVKKLGGNWEIKSGEQAGTQIQVLIPLSETIILA
ncbi:tetratricopeptide repeat protein [Maribacter sp. 2307ULW6-5]|uniref:ATP-binding protein n=1 Tax=Maribacter sp. 2307ULW6-5 TaxID=3386275 RepID=UPI0039BD5A67